LRRRKFRVDGLLSLFQVGEKWGASFLALTLAGSGRNSPSLGSKAIYFALDGSALSAQTLDSHRAADLAWVEQLPPLRTQWPPDSTPLKFGYDDRGTRCDGLAITATRRFRDDIGRATIEPQIIPDRLEGHYSFFADDCFWIRLP
jgi:hypothetical protein